MRLFTILTIGVIRSSSKPVSEDFEDLSFHEDEFQYFYNLELVQELTTDTEASKTDKDPESGNSTRLDDALQKLEEEGRRTVSALRMEFTEKLKASEEENRKLQSSLGEKKEIIQTYKEDQKSYRKLARLVWKATREKISSRRKRNKM